MQKKYTRSDSYKSQRKVVIFWRMGLQLGWEPVGLLVPAMLYTCSHYEVVHPKAIYFVWFFSIYVLFYNQWVTKYFKVMNV